jgi:hypothetical protein
MSGEMLDAYRNPLAVRPGCQHQLGCKCQAPYWLRPSTAAEELTEAQLCSVLTQPLIAEESKS